MNCKDSGLPENEIRKRLDVPPLGSPHAKRVMILSQSSHLDWDWLLIHPSLLDNVPADTIGYFDPPLREAVSRIFPAAARLLKDHSRYYYSIAEIAFLRGFAELDTAQYNELIRAGDRLRIVGGGLTSPDNLLPNGEAFIRNYLAGQRWLRANTPALLPFCLAWLPDDFGHDSQLPVVIEAMGLNGVGFGRLPPVADRELTGEGGRGVDFRWRAADGSTILGHYMQKLYNQDDQYRWNTNDLKVLYDWHEAASNTDYIFLSFGGDFAMPKDILAICKRWNDWHGPGRPRVDGVWAAAGTFDHYEALVKLNGERKPVIQEFTFLPTPFWTGFYASRPELKIRHHATARVLLAGEALAVTAGVGGDECVRGWDLLSPSTHHDYITGTATDVVYQAEQLVYLLGANDLGKSAVDAATRAIAGRVAATPRPGESAVVVFNTLGFERTGMVEAPATPGEVFGSVRLPDGSRAPIFQARGGGWLFTAPRVRSFGHQTVYLSPEVPTVAPDDRVQAFRTDDGWTLTNGRVSARITRGSTWGLASLTVDGVELLAQGGSGGNALKFYVDRGNIYCFANEFSELPEYSDWYWHEDPDGSLMAGPAGIVEQSPARCTLRTQAEFWSRGEGKETIRGSYTREYTLVAGETFLRMSLTGAAPLADGHPAMQPKGTGPDPLGKPYSVMISFPLAAAGGNSFQHGTACHWADWSTPSPRDAWQTPVFQATHDFVLPSGQRQPVAFYHQSLPACAIDAAGTLMACALRNTPGGYADPPIKFWGANGSDHAEHTHRYALGVPSPGDPRSGAPLRQSLGWASRMLAVVKAGPGGSLSTDYSLAQVTAGSAILTVAKALDTDPGAMVLRVYNPTNNQQEPVTVSLGGFASLFPGWRLAVWQVTALENDLDTPRRLPVNGTSVSFTAARALTTLLVRPLRSGESE